MYYTEDPIEQSEKSYIDGILNEKIEFYPLENYLLVFCGNGKLVGLQKKNEAPGVFIDNEDEREAFMVYFILQKNQ